MILSDSSFQSFSVKIAGGRIAVFWMAATDDKMITRFTQFGLNFSIAVQRQGQSASARGLDAAELLPSSPLRIEMVPVTAAA